MPTTQQGNPPSLDKSFEQKNDKKISSSSSKLQTIVVYKHHKTSSVVFSTRIVWAIKTIISTMIVAILLHIIIRVSKTSRPPSSNSSKTWLRWLEFSRTMWLELLSLTGVLRAHQTSAWITRTKTNKTGRQARTSSCYMFKDPSSKSPHRRSQNTIYSNCNSKSNLCYRIIKMQRRNKSCNSSSPSHHWGNNHSKTIWAVEIYLQLRWVKLINTLNNMAIKKTVPIIYIKVKSRICSNKIISLLLLL